MRNQHIWTERTEEGEKREMRATKFGGRWKLESRLEEEEYFTEHNPPTLEELEKLRDILFRKYQRKRLPWDDVAAIDAWIERQGGKSGGQP